MTELLSGTDFAVGITERYFEDYVPGSVYEFGHVVISEAEILDFARQFDPQPIHVDPDELRWPAPVRPGDRLRLRVRVISARPSNSKPDRGVVRSGGELLNQNDQTVLSLTAVNMLRRRDS